MISKPLVTYILTAALRDRLVITLLLMMGLGAAVSVFLGSAGVTEQESFSLVFGANGLRFLGVLGVVLFCCFYMRRSFETKEVEFLLSRPLSRMTFLVSHATAFVLLASFIAVITVAAVYCLGKPDPGGLLAWGTSVFVENIIMVATALFFSMVMSSAAAAALASLGFYVLARLIGTLLGIAAAPPENALYAFLNNAMDFISIIIPRLDLLGQTSWLVYGVDGANAGVDYLRSASSWSYTLMESLGLMNFVLAQGAVFLALTLAAAAHDFVRRQF